MFYQGRYKPQNISKYRGNPDNICYRSSWEYKAFRFCDLNENVIYWNSEETIIPYISPIDGRPHRYFMDLKIWFKKKDGTMGISLVEIKPYAQTQEPVKKQGKKKERFLEECRTYAVNQAKWDAARRLCESEKWNFVIWTEKELQISGSDGSELAAQKKYEQKLKTAFNKKNSVRAQLISNVIKNQIKNELDSKNKS